MTSRLVCAQFFHNPTVGGKLASKKSLGDHVIYLDISKTQLGFFFYIFRSTLSIRFHVLLAHFIDLAGTKLLHLFAGTDIPHLWDGNPYF